MAVHPDVPVQSVAELIKLAKEKRGQLNYGSPGNGTPPHLAGELFRLMAGIQVTHVPYKGGAAALDLVAGRTKLHAEIAKAVRSREGREWLAASGAAPGGEPPEQFAAFIKAEYEKWGRLVREAGIKVE